MSLKFLRNLFNFYTEKKPKEDMSKFGVFIRNSQNDGEIIDGCRRFLQDIKSDTKIVAVKKNEVCKGMEVFFNCGSGVLELLKKKNLSGSKGVSTIHSLTTALSLHDAFPIEEEDFKKTVRSQIQNFSSVQVLDILKVPYDWKYPDIGSGKWIIVLDIPEVDDLDVFNAMGLPDNMLMEFPSNGGCYSVKFYCRLCQKDGHAQFRCLKGASEESDFSPENKSSFVGSINNTSITEENTRPSIPINIIPGEAVESFMDSNLNLCPTESRIYSPKSKDGALEKASNSAKKLIPNRDSESSISQPSRPTNLTNQKVLILPKPSASKVSSHFRIRDKFEERVKPFSLSQEAIDALKIEIGEKEAQRYYNDRNKKQEMGKSNPSSPLKRPINSCVTQSSDPPAKRLHLEKDLKSNAGESSDRASSTTIDTDLAIIFESKIPPESSSNPPDNSPVVTTTHHQLEATVKTELPITDDEDSNPPPPKGRKPSKMLQVVIPENIRTIINAVPEKVLDIQHLEAFFNHVKKKSRPADFARMYTENVEGLFGQLSEISRRYYLSPIVGSNEDLKFVKMLGNVLQRFHNGPAKRRGDTKM